MSLAPLGFAATLRRDTSSKKAGLSCSCGGLYEGYLDDTFGKSFYPLLIDRIAFSGQHSGLHEFHVGQRPAEGLGPRTPVRFQKIACIVPQKILCLVLTSEAFRILERLLRLDRYRLSNSSRLDW